MLVATCWQMMLMSQTVLVTGVIVALCTLFVMCQTFLMLRRRRMIMMKMLDFALDMKEEMVEEEITDIMDEEHSVEIFDNS